MNNTLKLASKLTLTTDLSPEKRDREYRGRFKQIFSLISAHPVKILGINLLGFLFFIPFFAIFLYVLPEMAEKAVLTAYNFVGGLGIGYGATDEAMIIEATKAIYDVRLEYVLYYLVPSIMFFSIGMAGVYNCMRNMLWNVECKVLKHFFVGIKRHWYKFLIAYTVLAIVAVGVVYPILEIIKCGAIGVACSAGWWVLLIASCIVGLLLAGYYMVLVPMFVTYKYSTKMGENLKITFKNSALLYLINFLQVVFITIFAAAPMALSFISVVKYLIVVLIAVYGIAFYTLVNIEYSQYLTDNFIFYLYNKKQDDDKKEKEKQAKEYRAQRERELKQQKTNGNKKKR